MEDDFGQVIRKTKVNVNFLFKLRFHLDRVEKKQQKIKLRKLRSLSPNSVYKKLLIERFYEHLPHFRFKLDFVKLCNSNVEDFEKLFNILTLDNMSGFIEKNKVPFNSVKNLAVNRHLYLDFENNERVVVNSAWDFVSVNYLKIIVMILRLRKKLMITGLNKRIIDWRESLLVKMLSIYRKDYLQSQKFRFFQKDVSLCPHLIG